MSSESCSSQRILLIIPCYNESASIGTLLQEIEECLPTCDTLVVDDGSEDDTYEIASKSSACLRLIANLGIGGAVQTGIKYAFRKGYDLCIQVDGDGQHPPDQVELLTRGFLADRANMVIGSRFIDQTGFRSSRMRRLGIAIIRRSLANLYGEVITDPTSGFRLMDRRAMELFCAEYPYDFPEPISVGDALDQSLRVIEVPVTMRERKAGKSSIGGLKNLSYMFRVIGYLLLKRVGRLMGP
ncbi:MAG: glycosyltransferase [Acidobacteria bacterium]|nr:glycosyltransferase [Acidobacteriota bacterium]